MGHHSRRTVTTLQGVTRLTRHACIAVATKSVCVSISQHGSREEESWALPHGEFGLDVIALVGMLRDPQ